MNRKSAPTDILIVLLSSILILYPEFLAPFILILILFPEIYLHHFFLSIPPSFCPFCQSWNKCFSLQMNKSIASFIKATIADSYRICITTLFLLTNLPTTLFLLFISLSSTLHVALSFSVYVSDYSRSPFHTRFPFVYPTVDFSFCAFS